MRHLDNMAKIMLATGLMVAYGYVIEAFMAWYSGNTYERYSHDRTACSGPTRVCYWMLIACNILIPQVLWFKQRAAQPGRCCSSSPWSSTSACGWSASSSSSPACTAISCRRRGACTSRTSGTGPRYVGTLGLFLCLLFLFIRFLPMISIFEMRTLLPEAQVAGGGS